MRVYVATAYANKYAAVDAAAVLRGAGHAVTSRWHADGLSREEAAAVEGDWDASARAAAGCYWDVARADALVMLHVPGMRGAYCELGYALALDRHVGGRRVAARAADVARPADALGAGRRGGRLVPEPARRGRLVTAAVVQAYAPSPYRVRLVLSAAPAGAALQPGSYAFSRADGGGGTAIRATYLVASDGASVELAVLPALAADTVYVVDNPFFTGPARVAWRPPVAAAVSVVTDDPEAEAFGVDIDWLATDLDTSRDAPAVAGRACLLHDVAAIIQTHPGELFHRPQDGAGVDLDVNGPTDLDAIGARIRAACATDPRVRSTRVTVTETATGAVSASIVLQPVATLDALSLVVRG